MMSVLSLELGVFIAGILGASVILQKNYQESGGKGVIHAVRQPDMQRTPA